MSITQAISQASQIASNTGFGKVIRITISACKFIPLSSISMKFLYTDFYLLQLKINRLVNES